VRWQLLLSYACSDLRSVNTNGKNGNGDEASRHHYQDADNQLLQLREWCGKAAKPNTRLMTPIACSTLARIFDLVRFFARSISSTTALWW
jgi:hypothetical protein